MIVYASSHTKCVLLGNQKYTTQATIISLHPNDYTHRLHYSPFAVKLDRRIVSCITPNHFSNKVCEVSQ